MDHHTIETEAVIERYVTHRLSEEEAQAFEEHFLDCPPCLERIETAERLGRGLSGVVAQEVARAGVLGALRRMRFAGWAVAGLGLAVAAGLAVFTVRQGGQLERLRGELAASRTVASGFEARAGGAERERTAVEQDLEAARSELERWRAPVVAMPLALLTPLRGGEEVFPLTLPREGRWVGLWVELGGEELPAYRASLRAPGGEVIFESDELRLNELGALLLQLPAERLAPGRFTLTIEDPRRRDPAPLASFALQLSRED